MHKSKLGGIIIDCDTEDLDRAASFWAQALGSPPVAGANYEKSPYVELDMRPNEPYVEIQKVDHDSRAHIDIETDDVEAEVGRLERLGAERIAAIRNWVVMLAPTGQKFCVVPVLCKDFAEKARTWD